LGEFGRKKGQSGEIYQGIISNGKKGYKTDRGGEGEKVGRSNGSKLLTFDYGQ